MDDMGTEIELGSGWQTKLSDSPNLQFVRLTDDEGLTLIINKDPEDASYRIYWPSYCAYRNRWEELGPAWSKWDQASVGTGCTNMILNSEWILHMRKGSAYFMETLWPDVKHFAIRTGDFITEVLSEDEPSITQIEYVEPNYMSNKTSN